MAGQKGNIREEINRRRFGIPMKQALRRVLNGESYRQAAAAEEIDHADLWKAATSIAGLCEEHLRAWRNSWSERSCVNARRPPTVNHRPHFAF